MIKKIPIDVATFLMVCWEILKAAQWNRVGQLSGCRQTRCIKINMHILLTFNKYLCPDGELNEEAEDDGWEHANVIEYSNLCM
jgi:hypothetical protein